MPKRRRRRQFSLRSLLVLFLLVALPLGWVCDQRGRVLREQQAVEAIYACGGYVMYEHDSAIFHRGPPPGPEWLKWVLGEYFFTRLDLVFLPPGLTESELAPVSALRGAKRLQLGGTGVTDATLAHVARFPELTELNLAATEVTDAGVACLRGMPRLKVLYLPFTPISDRAVEILCDIHSLETVDLMGTSVSRSAGQELEKRIRQHHSERAPATDGFSKHVVSWLPIPSETERKIAARIARYGAGLQRSVRSDSTKHPLAVAIWHSLDRRRGRQALPLLPHLTSLTELALVGMSLNYQDIEHLRCIPNLEHLDLHSTPITTGQWRRLASDAPCDAAKPHAIPPDAASNSGLPDHLESLSYVHAPITNADVEQIARISKLAALSFAETPLTDAALVHLESLPNLTSLDLGGTAITDDGLSHLETLTNLRYLQLYGTKVTAQGVERLRAALPGLNVPWYAQPSDTEMVP